MNIRTNVFGQFMIGKFTTDLKKNLIETLVLQHTSLPVQLVVFSKHDPFLNQTQIYTAFRSVDYGYARMEIMNETHLYLEQVSDDQVKSS